MHKKVHVYVNVELRKKLHVHFYIVSKTEKIHYYQLWRHNTICLLELLTVHFMYKCSQYTSSIFSSFSLSILSPIADWYTQKSHWLKLRLRRSVWGSLLNKYPQSLSCNHPWSNMEELSISRSSEKRLDRGGNFARNAQSDLLELVD